MDLDPHTFYRIAPDTSQFAINRGRSQYWTDVNGPIPWPKPGVAHSKLVQPEQLDRAPADGEERESRRLQASVLILPTGGHKKENRKRAVHIR